MRAGRARRARARRRRRGTARKLAVDQLDARAAGRRRSPGCGPSGAASRASRAAHASRVPRAAAGAELLSSTSTSSDTSSARSESSARSARCGRSRVRTTASRLTAGGRRRGPPTGVGTARSPSCGRQTGRATGRRRSRATGQSDSARRGDGRRPCGRSSARIDLLAEQRRGDHHVRAVGADRGGARSSRASHRGPARSTEMSSLSSGGERRPPRASRSVRKALSVPAPVPVDGREVEEERAVVREPRVAQRTDRGGRTPRSRAKRWRRCGPAPRAPRPPPGRSSRAARSRARSAARRRPAPRHDLVVGAAEGAAAAEQHGVPAGRASPPATSPVDAVGQQRARAGPDQLVAAVADCCGRTSDRADRRSRRGSPRDLPQPSRSASGG